MTTSASASTRTLIGPHCRALTRGSLGDEFDGRSREGKFLRRIEAELTAQVGGSPSFGQKLLIRRISRATLRLEAFDAKLDAGSWTSHDARTYGGLSNSLRLMLKELGLKAAAPKAPSLQDYIASKAAAKAAAEVRLSRAQET